MKHWTDYITKRGWFVIGVIVGILIATIIVQTRDVCWVGLDRVSCEVLIDEVTK